MGNEEVNKIILTPVEGSFVTHLPHNEDSRGYFSELYNIKNTPKTTKVTMESWRQVSFSYSKANVLRGIHYSPYGKLVTCLSGRLTDVVVDLRPASKTFGRWFMVELSEENHRQFYIPPFCGHGFITHEPSRVMYVQGDTYYKDMDKCVRFDDPFLNIQWPKGAGDEAPIISAKDQAAPLVADAFPFSKGRSPLGRTMIIGASGQVGSALEAVYGADNVMGSYSKKKAGDHQFSLDMEEVARSGLYADVLVQGAKPTEVIICAAMTWVDGCERDEARCFAINEKAPAKLAAAAAAVGAKVVFFSTEYVFDGKNGPYTEDDAPCPVNTYGRSKLAGEKAVMAAAPDALVCRTTVVYGPEQQKKNFACQLLRALSPGGPGFMRVPNDQVSSPTYNRDLATMVAGLVAKGASGVFNTVGPEVLDRAAFAKRLAAAAGLNADGVQPGTTAELYTAALAVRPLGAGLKMDKAKGVLGDALPQSTVEEAVADWNANHDLAAYKKPQDLALANKVWYAPNMHQAYGDDEIQAVVESLRAGWLAPGPLTEQFEKEVAAYFGKNAALMVNSGSAANIIGLSVLDLPRGSEVVTPACTFATAVSPIIQLGLVPVFIDSELTKYVPSVEQVVAAITPKTSCLFIPNLGGGKIDWTRLRQVVHVEMKRPDIVLFEDSCDTMTCTPDSDVSAISFYASHIITAGGCGGCVMFRDPALRAKALQYRDWGRIGSNIEDVSKRFGYKVDGVEYDFKFLYSVLGYNMKCSEMNAAFGLVQMSRLTELTKIRADNIHRFCENLKGTSYVLPDDHESFDWLAMPIQYPRRGALLRFLENNNVQVRCFFAGNITRHPAYRGEYLKEYKNADLIMERAFLIGAHHGLTFEDIDGVCNLLKEFERLDKAGLIKDVVDVAEEVADNHDL